MSSSYIPKSIEFFWQTDRPQDKLLLRPPLNYIFSRYQSVLKLLLRRLDIRLDNLNGIIYTNVPNVSNVGPRGCFF